MIKTLKISFFLFAAIYFVSSCNDESYTTSSADRLTYSTDTITFDTIFTRVGSVTKLFKLYNFNKKPIKISSAYLKGGVSSNYRISIDGENNTEFRNLLIPSDDSLFVFVEVTLDPVNNNLPMVVEDAIVFNSNGNSDEIILESFGQDVHLFRGEVIESETWNNDKPYLIYNNLIVDEDNTLTIKPGVKVYLHYNSSLVVLGKLQVLGTFEEQVVFEGDRFDYGYDKSAGRWGTIVLMPGSEASIQYALIKNATAGLQVGQPNEDEEFARLELINTQIINSSWAGLLAFGSEINAYNCIIADAKNHGLVLFMGGKYNFYHTTVSLNGAYSVVANNIETYSRSSDGLGVALLNFYSPHYTYDENFLFKVETIPGDMVEANFYNSIIYGRNKSEFDTIDNQENLMNFYFDHCLVKNDTFNIEDSEHFNAIIENEDPMFINDSLLLGELDFRLDTLSPAKDAGSFDIVNQHSILQFDFEGKSRLADGKPDLGAIEREE
ncbi:MAG: hypothetical protein JXA77_04370 [Bacteroidales bacterium]|nr:hypothetical protein [Bacteroidales bacterium]MBN2819789.1 hypothetical protein [Bacteroidales bacterium]